MPAPASLSSGPAAHTRAGRVWDVVGASQELAVVRVFEIDADKVGVTPRARVGPRASGEARRDAITTSEISPRHTS